MAVEGRLARFVYLSLYRMHLIAIHGWFRGALLIAIGRVKWYARGSSFTDAELRRWAAPQSRQCT